MNVLQKRREVERIAIMNRACFMGIISMLVFGTIGIFRRFIPISSELLAFSRGILGALYLLGFIVITKRKKERLSGMCLLKLVITGALIGLKRQGGNSRLFNCRVIPTSGLLDKCRLFINADRSNYSVIPS